MSADLETFRTLVEDVRAEVGKVIIGQHDAIEKALIVIFTGSTR